MPGASYLARKEYCSEISSTVRHSLRSRARRSLMMALSLSSTEPSLTRDLRLEMVLDASRMDLLNRPSLVIAEGES
eukprot:812293-Heterocapsa_arctica.AAC.1